MSLIAIIGFFSSIFQDLQNLHDFTPLRTWYLSKNVQTFFDLFTFFYFFRTRSNLDWAESSKTLKKFKNVEKRQKTFGIIYENLKKVPKRCKTSKMFKLVFWTFSRFSISFQTGSKPDCSTKFNNVGWNVLELFSKTWAFWMFWNVQLILSIYFWTQG